MKNTLLTILLIFSLGLFSQGKYSTFYYQRSSLFAEFPTSKKDILFLGNSITNGGEWVELFDNKYVKNRGISGDVTLGVLDRLEPIVKGQPKKIFLLIGINDLSQGISPDAVVSNIEKIVVEVLTKSPRTKIYLQSILPVNADLKMFSSHTSKVEEIKEVNQLMQDLAKKTSVTYIDLYTHFVLADTDKLDPQYTNDGLHLLGAGYIHWRNIVLPYVK